MQTSQEVKNLMSALAKAQAAFPDIPKDKEVQAGQRKYRYSDLATILSKTRKPLTENGIAVTMGTEVKDGAFILTCRVCHSTGEWIEATYPMPKDQGSQVIGSAMTYGRRYLISALLNICADDDTDGEEAKDVPHGNGKPAPEAPKTIPGFGKQPKPKEEAKPPANPHDGLANVTVHGIQAAKINGIDVSVLKTSGGDFIVDIRKATAKDILRTAKNAEDSKTSVVIDYLHMESGNNVVKTLRMEG